MTQRPDERPIPTVLCIDVEPDGKVPTAGARWTGLEAMVPYAERLRERLTAATGAAATFAWFLRMDPQIEALHGSPAWVADRYRGELEGLRGVGDALGTHTHAWRRSAGGDSPWIADWGDSGWTSHCLTTSLGAFHEAFGEPCRIHRFGDRYLDPSLVAALAASDVRVDLSAEPGARPDRSLYRGWHTTGRPVDYASAPREPYRPDPSDPLRPGGPTGPTAAAGGLWFLPLTAVDATKTLAPWRRAARAARSPGRVRHRPILLWAPGPAPALWAALEAELAAADRPYLALALRADVLLSERAAAVMDHKIDHLLGSRLAPRLRLVDPIRAVAALRPEAADRGSGRRSAPDIRDAELAAPLG